MLVYDQHKSPHHSRNTFCLSYLTIASSAPCWLDMSPYPKIDCHSHYLPPGYREALAEHGHKQPDGIPAIPPWSEEGHLEMMQTINVTKSMLSVSSPGTYLKPGDEALSRELTRYVNDYGGSLKKRKPDNFGFFASMPLADIEGSLEEIPYALDHLNADGFVVMTNFQGSYLGHKDFDPIFDELNRRKAIVFMHPTTPCLPHGGPAATPLPEYPRPMFEFLFDTARAVINLFMSGTVSRCPNVTFLVPHVGGAFPPLINRFANVGLALSLPGMDPKVTPTWIKERLNQQFYFDTAGWTFPEQIKGLLEYVTVDRMLYGSDFPFTPLRVVTPLSQEHDQYLPEVFPNPEDREKLCSKNALKLFSRET
ncbi:Decarboxylase macB [Exophiala dermatitidis]